MNTSDRQAVKLHIVHTPLQLIILAIAASSRNRAASAVVRFWHQTDTLTQFAEVRC